MFTVSRLERQFATLCLFHAPTCISPLPLYISPSLLCNWRTLPSSPSPSLPTLPLLLLPAPPPPTDSFFDAPGGGGGRAGRWRGSPLQAALGNEPTPASILDEILGPMCAFCPALGWDRAPTKAEHISTCPSASVLDESWAPILAIACYPDSQKKTPRVAAPAVASYELLQEVVSKEKLQISPPSPSYFWP